MTTVTHQLDFPALTMLVHRLGQIYLLVAYQLPQMAAVRANAAWENTSIGIGEEGNSSVGDEERRRIEAEIEERGSLRGSFDASQ